MSPSARASVRHMAYARLNLGRVPGGDGKTPDVAGAEADATPAVVRALPCYESEDDAPERPTEAMVREMREFAEALREREAGAGAAQTDAPETKDAETGANDEDEARVEERWGAEREALAAHRDRLEALLRTRVARASRNEPAKKLPSTHDGSDGDLSSDSDDDELVWRGQRRKRART